LFGDNLGGTELDGAWVWEIQVEKLRVEEICVEEIQAEGIQIGEGKTGKRKGWTVIVEGVLFAYQYVEQVPIQFSGLKLMMCAWLAIDRNHAEGLLGMVLTFVVSCYWEFGILMDVF